MSLHYYYPQTAKSYIRQATSAAEASASYSENLGTDKKGDLWIKSFLINTDINKRGWSVDPNTIRENVKSIIGKPLVMARNALTGRIDHPVWDTRKSAEANYESQLASAIGTVEDYQYDPRTNTYYAISRITVPAVRDELLSKTNPYGKNNKLPIAVSPQILYNPSTEQANYYKNWTFSHLSLVDEPAYGPQAVGLEACNGDKKTCSQKLQQVTAAAAAASSSPDSSVLPQLRRPTVYHSWTRVPENGKRPGCIT